MKSLQALAQSAYTSILGALGTGAPGGSPTGNNISQINAATIGPSAAPQWDSSPFVSKTGRVLVQGFMSLSGGTMAPGDQIIGALLQDGVAISAQAFVASEGGLAFFSAVQAVTVTPGVSHVYSITSTVGGGHTAEIVTGRANITVIDL